MSIVTEPLVRRVIWRSIQPTSSVDQLPYHSNPCPPHQQYPRPMMIDTHGQSMYPLFAVPRDSWPREDLPRPRAVCWQLTHITHTGWFRSAFRLQLADGTSWCMAGQPTRAIGLSSANLSIFLVPSPHCLSETQRYAYHSALRRSRCFARISHGQPCGSPECSWLVDRRPCDRPVGPLGCCP